MIDLIEAAGSIIEIVTEAHQVIKYPGYFLLRYVFRRKIEPDKNSFTVYVLGFGFWLVLVILIWGAMRLLWK
jgi:hypothetical protein